MYTIEYFRNDDWTKNRKRISEVQFIFFSQYNHLVIRDIFPNAKRIFCIFVFRNSMQNSEPLFFIHDAAVIFTLSSMEK